MGPGPPLLSVWQVWAEETAVMTGAHEAAKTGRGLPFKSHLVSTHFPCLAETIGESRAFSPGNCLGSAVPLPKPGPRGVPP